MKITFNYQIEFCMFSRKNTCFPPLDAYLAPSSTMEASTQGGGFQGSCSSGLLGPLFKVHGIFSNKTYFLPLEDNQGQ